MELDQKSWIGTSQYYEGPCPQEYNSFGTLREVEAELCNLAKVILP